MSPPATFPPDCLLCEAMLSVRGMELGKALRLLARALDGECVCTIGLAHHDVLHPHAAALVGCPGARPHLAAVIPHPERRMPAREATP